MEQTKRKKRVLVVATAIILQVCMLGAVFSFGATDRASLYDELLHQKHNVTYESTTEPTPITDFVSSMYMADKGTGTRWDFIFWAMLSDIDWTGGSLYDTSYKTSYQMTQSQLNTYEKAKASLEKKLKLKKAGTEVQAAKDIYYLAKWEEENIFYDGKRTNPYYALADGLGNCRAYATVFYDVCRDMDIPCRIVITGKPEVYDDCHAINEVKLGNKWYYVDTTWGGNSVELVTSKKKKVHMRYFLYGTKNSQYHERYHIPWSGYRSAGYNAAFPPAKGDYTNTANWRKAEKEIFGKPKKARKKVHKTNVNKGGKKRTRNLKKKQVRKMQKRRSARKTMRIPKKRK